MSKLDALKEKLNASRAGLAEKLDKITLFRKWREKKEPAQSRPASSYSLGAIYRNGNTLTRIQVIIVYFLFIGALAATFQAGRKMFTRMGSGTEHQKLKEDTSRGFAEMAQKVVENANLISLGKFTTRAYTKDSGVKMMAVDIWVRVSDPKTAEFVQKNETILQDKITEAMGEMFTQEVDPLSISGKNTAKDQIQESMNKALPDGKVEEVFFQNLIVQ